MNTMFSFIRFNFGLVAKHGKSREVRIDGDGGKSITIT